MKKAGLILFLFLNHLGWAQSIPIKFWIQFTDKANTPYSVSNPTEFLSQRAIDRRVKQSIEITESDLPLDTAYLSTLVNAGVSIHNKSKWFNAVSIQAPDSTVLNEIIALPFVKNSTPVEILKRSNQESTSPISYFKHNNINKNHLLDYGSSFNQINMIGGECLHEKGYQGDGIEIAVIDAGFVNANSLAAFDTIRSNNGFINKWNFVDNDTNVFAHDDHGTLVLSTMAGNLPGQLVGTSPKAKYHLFISEEGGKETMLEEDNWVAAAEFADSAGVDVINTSLGYNTFDNSSLDYTYADMNGNTARISIASDIAVSKGMILVSGAGNEGDDPWRYISAPADADSIIAVGAVDANKNYAGFSSIGPTSDGRVKPDVVAQGSGAITASVFGGIQSANGTSFASPIVAGMVACLWQANPNKRNTEIIAAIKQSSSSYYMPNNTVGYGIPNFCVANELLKGKDSIFFQEDNVVFSSSNPFTNSINGVFFSVKTQHVLFQLFDVTGKIITMKEQKFYGNNYNDFNLANLDFAPDGIYLLKITGGNKNFNYKILKKS